MSCPLIAVWLALGPTNEVPSATWTMSASEVGWQLVLVLGLVILNGFFVAAEFALVKVRASQLQEAEEEGRSAASQTLKMVHALDPYLSACQLGITLASLALGWLGEPFIARLLGPLLIGAGLSDAWVRGVAFLIAFSCITFLHVVAGELMPKSLAIRKSFETSLIVAKPLHLFYLIFRWPIAVLNGSGNWVLKKLFRIDPITGHESIHSTEELSMLIDQSEKGLQVTSTEREILQNALLLNERTVKEIITPRVNVISLDEEASFQKNLEMAIISKHTRFPVVKGHLDNTIGLVHVKDLLAEMQTSEPCLKRILRPITVVPEQLELDKLLKLFLESQSHMGLVVDEFGGALGLVMLEDVIEELVGEIKDEFDEESKDFRRLGDGFVIKARVPLYEMEELVGLALESEDVSTVGGFVTHRLGYLPRIGEKIILEEEGYEVTVLDADERVVIELVFRKLVQGTNAPMAEGELVNPES